MAFPLYNIRFMLLISASFITIFSSIAIYFCLPILISHVIRTQISLSPSSGSFNDWLNNSVIDQIYLFNISNLDELVSNESLETKSLKKIRPKLSQIGPFTFRQDREKLNVKFNPNNETVLYDQKKRWTFLPELSLVKRYQDLNSLMINHINVPLAGTTLNPEYAEFVQPIVSEFDLRLFLGHSAMMLLFDGYYDILMEQAKSSGQIDVDKFGWMHNLNNSVSKNFRIFTGPSNATLDKFGGLDEYNFKKLFNIWHHNGTNFNEINNTCNDFRFSSAGEFFPPPEYSIISYNNYMRQQAQRQTATATVTNHNKTSGTFDPNSNDNSQQNSLTNQKRQSLTNKSGDDDGYDDNKRKIGKTISLFMPDLCRVFTLYYNHSYDYNDLLVDRYIATEFTYAYKKTDAMQQQSSSFENYNLKLGSMDRQINSNKCYCIYDENTKLTNCPPNGMMDLFTCRKGSPLTISFPYFHYSNHDQTLSPYLKLFEYEHNEINENDYKFFVDLESSLNVPVKAQIVIQFNVHYRNDPSLNFTPEYSFLLPEKTIGSDLYLPQMWFKSTAEIDVRNLNNLKFIQKHLGLITPIATISIFAIASILLLMSAKLAYDLTYVQESRKFKIGNKSSDEELELASLQPQNVVLDR